MKPAIFAFLFSSIAANCVFANEIQYQIPAPVKYAQYASMSLSYQVTKDPQAKLVSVSYTLPAKLLGYDQEVFYSGTIDAAKPDFHMNSALADMDCTKVAGGGANCQVMHHNMRVNFPKLQNVLNHSQLSLEEIKGRMEFAKFLDASGGEIGGQFFLPATYYINDFPGPQNWRGGSDNDLPK